MSNLTEEQKLAVEKENSNIIVSAGAGSGKTTVLKNRVLRILKKGITIDKLIILTFTNNAAQEMKERIRKIINENKDVSQNAQLIDTSYITTFDSFANSLVKKYSYLLNIDKDFTIIDPNLINRQMDIYLDEIFEYMYKSNRDFQKMISDLCVKNDNQIRDNIKNIYRNLTNIIDRRDYLNSYLSKYSNDETIESMFQEFEEHLFRIVEDIRDNYEELQDETIDATTLEKNDLAIANLLNATTYDEIFTAIDFSFERHTNKRYTDEAKAIKEIIKNNIKSLKAYKIGESKKEVIERYKSTIDYVKVIIDILLQLDDKLNDYKQRNNSYEFYDIAFKAIDLVKNFDQVRNELKENTYEIMIDEYQDTNDIQETFISYISNNNVYMVGDIKQSIYRFRNANPYIFKNKYDNYKIGNNGFKIDLNKNFRSRLEVVEAINLVFKNIMTDDIGGSNYVKEHMMEYGNKAYDNFNVNDNYNLEILNYNNDDNKYNSSEAECFIIANDIMERINNHEQVTYFDENTMKVRDISYKDFVILVDKSKNFDLLKRILESKNIPTVIDKDMSIKEEDEIYILKNLINIIIHIKKSDLNVDFKHSWLSIARSYIGGLSDNAIFDIFKNNSFKETEIYKKLLNISQKCDSLSASGLIKILIRDFNIINCGIYDGNINDKLAKLEMFINSTKSLNELGYDLYSINDYFDELLKSNNDIKMASNINDGNAVTIMTIHGSKGLEFPYVYLPFLNSDFTRSIEYPLFDFNKNVGIIAPFYENGYGNTFAYYLNDIIERQESLSEKIRLFYVAMTRAKEKIILINKENNKLESSVNISYSDLINVKRLADFINILKYSLSKYIKNVDLSQVGITREFNNVDNNIIDNFDKTKKITTKELNINIQVLESKHFSKSLRKVIDKELKQRLDYGTHMHYVFEVYDFINGNMNDLNVDDDIKEKVKKFLQHEELQNIKSAKIYKEKEIMFTKNGNTFHGFIDLMLEYEDHFDIIDYKLSNIESEEYKIQLNGYKEYIENNWQKKTNIYLYSINKDILKKIG